MSSIDPFRDSQTGGGGGSVAVDDSGTEVTAEASRLNFGTGLDVTDDGAGAVTIDTDIGEVVGEFINAARDHGATGDGTTDDSAALQAALDAADTAGGGTVWVPAGTYAISETLHIGSNTLLWLSQNATIRRDANFSRMLLNRSDGSGGYDAATNIAVVGGTWDNNATNYTGGGGSNMLAFGHMRNLTIRDVRLLDVWNYHHIEINAVQHALIVGCRFEGMDFDRDTEAVQIDLMKSSSHFGGFGPYDDTPCDDVKVIDCVFVDVPCGVGSHSSTNGVSHTNVLIDGCTFVDNVQVGIRAESYAGLTVSGNLFVDCAQAVEIYDDATGARSGFLVADNQTVATPAGLTVGASSGSLSDVVVSGNRLSTVSLDAVTRVVLVGNVIDGAVSTSLATVDLGESSNFIDGVWTGDDGDDPAPVQVDTHRLVVLVDDGAGGMEPLVDGDGLWLYGAFPGLEYS